MVLPGGFGTLDELFEALTLVQTGKVTTFPIVLVGSAYWSGLLAWLRTTVSAQGKIAAADLDLLSVADDPDEVVRIIVARTDAGPGSGRRRRSTDAWPGAQARPPDRAARVAGARDRAGHVDGPAYRPGVPGPDNGGGPAKVQTAAVAITAAGVAASWSASSGALRPCRVSPRARPSSPGRLARIAPAPRGWRHGHRSEVGAFGPRLRRLLRVGTHAEQQRGGGPPCRLGLPEHPPSMARFVVCQ